MDASRRSCRTPSACSAKSSSAGRPATARLRACGSACSTEPDEPSADHPQDERAREATAMNPDSLRSGDLGQRFLESFELTPALDPETLDQVYRVRHDVYCRDLGWEETRPDGRETDAFDEHSWHCLLRRRDTGEAVGCTRLIVPRPDDPKAPLPFEDTCRDSLDRTVADPSRMERASLGEVSRLAVVNTFRRRKGEAAVPLPAGDSDFTPLHEGERERFPFIPVSLYLGAAAMARR